MKLSAAASFSAILSLAQAQWWGGGRGGIGPDGGPDGYGFDGCARSCLSSIYPTSTGDWTAWCATPTPSALSSCLSSACTSTHTAYSYVTSAQSSICSAYSSCSSASGTAGCPNWPGWGGGGFGGWGAGWDGSRGSDGCYTLTGTRTGRTTSTLVVTTTSTNSGGSTVVATSTETRTATILAAAAASDTGTATSSTAPSATPNVAGKFDAGVGSMGALACVVFVAMVAL